jgi:putative drug exporter of the RND superfamily
LIAWTQRIVRNRRRVLALWIVLFLIGGAASADLGRHLSNRFSVPGSDAEKGLDLLKEHFHERSDSAFTLVAESTGPDVRTPQLRGEIRNAARRGAAEVPDGHAGAVIPASSKVAYVQITTSLDGADASNLTDEMRGAIGTIPGAKDYLTGFPALNEDTKPIFAEDLKRGELIAIPIALAVMAFMFGTLGGLAVPFVFAIFSIPVTLGFVWVFAQFMSMAVYVTNIVTLIGFAIAIDYSMLVVFRYREELDHGDAEHALERTMATAGRATLFSGMTVAIGLALLVFMPLPFMRSMGVGGLLVPLVSIAASATLLPALLATLGPGVNRFRFIPRRLLERRAVGEGGFWTRLAGAIMRRPIAFLVVAGALMIFVALASTRLAITAGDNRGTEALGVEATDGLAVLERTLGPGALAPHQIVVDTRRPDGAWSAQTEAAQQRLIAQLKNDPQVQDETIQAPVLLSKSSGVPPPGVVARTRATNLVDPSAQYLQVRAAGKTDAGYPGAERLVKRIRDTYVPEAGFTGAEVLVTGAPAFGVDFKDKAYGAFPYLVAAVLVLSYLLLLRAFRSVILPLKAVFMNLLSITATYGVLVLVFQDGHGTGLGFQSSPQIEAWIPIFLFAMLFGLSMDYEVFLLSRMREEWDLYHVNERAVAYGLEHTGRIITAAALIMVAAFSGFTAGSFVGLQEFGVGLSSAILLDATIVRMLLVPSVMKLLGEWNWYLPRRLARALT